MKAKKIKSVVLAALTVMTCVLIFCSLGRVEASAAYKVGDIVEYGTYPQSRVIDSTIISALSKSSKSWKSYGYYSGTGESDGKMKPSDYMKYADIKYKGEKYRAVKFTKYRPACTEKTASLNTYTLQDMNGYYVDTTYYFKYEPLKWRVLNPKDGLIMCENIIDSQAFQNTFFYNEYEDECYQDSSCNIYATNYEKSSIRKWLNNDFLNWAFTSSQRSKLLTSFVDNYVYWTDEEYEKYNSNSTNDKIFLLSYYNMITEEYGFRPDSVSDDVRLAYATEYAYCQGYGDYYAWWIRTPSASSRFECTVNDVGDLTLSLIANFTGGGVRPACRVSNLNSTVTPHKHKYDLWFTVQTATCSSNGLRVRTCLTCQKTVTQTIPKIKTVKLSKTSYTYNGKSAKPSVTVKDSKGNSLKSGTDYTLSYSNGRKNPGTYKVKIKFKGKYSGTKTLSFKISVGKVMGLKQIKKSGYKLAMEWKKVPGATDYEIQKYDSKKKKWVKIGNSKSVKIGFKKAKGTNKFRIKARIKINGKTYYGAYSSTLTTKS